MKRRELIQKLAALGVLPYIGVFDLLGAQAYAEALKKRKKTLLVIFQRGAVDGLSMVSPLGDSYFNKDLRPNIILPTDQLIKLDSFFGLSSAMSSFKSLWDKGQLTVIQQAGSHSSSRSHFDSQDYMETGTPDKKSTEDGFLARAAALFPDHEKAKITSLSVQPNLPRSISGDSKSLSFNDLNSFSIKGFGNSNTTASDGFEAFFETALDEVLKGQNKNSLNLLEDFAKAKKISLKEDYPKGQLAPRLKDIAKIIKSDIYIPFIVTESGGWDTHINQGNEKGTLANKLKEFSDSITAFVNELGPRIEDVTIITVTEFGRTVRENGNRGTDHGHGSCFFVINGNLKSKNIIANWKDLKKENLYEERDLPVTTDFRDVFSEILKTQFSLSDLSKVFPDYKVNKLGLYRA